MSQHKSLKDAIREKSIQDKLAKIVHSQMKSAYSKGLLVGSRSMLKVLESKLSETKGTPEERMDEGLKIIRSLLRMTDKTEEKENNKIEELIKAKNDDAKQAILKIVASATEEDDDTENVEDNGEETHGPAEDDDE